MLSYLHLCVGKIYVFLLHVVKVMYVCYQSIYTDCQWVTWMHIL